MYSGCNHPNLYDPVDAVIAWVNGADPLHKAKRIAAFGEQSLLKRFFLIPSGYSATRYVDSNEIFYCVRGIRRNLPWIRNIFLVTDDQRPDFLDDEALRELRVKIVDHRQIFPAIDRALPTFNSLSIASVLHRIPEIAPRFIYFNDDVIPVQPVSRSEFFHNNGVVLRGEWAPLVRFGQLRTIASTALNKVYALCGLRERSMFRLQQMRAARLAGFSQVYFEAAHAPHPVRAAVLMAYSDANPNLIERNSQYKFRHMNQFSAIVLAHHLELSNGTAETRGPADVLTIPFAKAKQAVANFERLQKDAGVKFVCLQSLDLAPRSLQEEVCAFLERRTQLETLPSGSA